MERNTSFYWGYSERSEKGSHDGDSIISETGLGLSIDNDEGSIQANLGASPPRGVLHPPSESVLAEESKDGTPLLKPYVGVESPYGSMQDFQAPRVLPRTVHAPRGKHNPSRLLKPSANRTIRCQVVVWYVGHVDVVQSHVMMRFRVTLFWNDDCPEKNSSGALGRIPSTIWTMRGRMSACQEQVSNDRVKKTVDVPPISIINAVQFETIGSPEIEMLSEESKLMRWTCMYSATLFQGDNMRVESFPHDEHQLVLKLGILAHRRSGQRWDKRKWTLALATEKDSRGSTRVPHGLLVDHVSIPDFKCQGDLKFEFVPMPLGQSTDQCLQVKLGVKRESRHYDRNIMPLLALLNIVAISCLVRNFASATASTETMLSIAFVEIGIRLTVDNRLPSVGYQIKIQSVLNQCFFMLCFLVFETNFVFWLVKKRGWTVATTDWIDFYVALLALAYTGHIWAFYYWNW
eukprot:CAMPEP_0172455744 /NCGR_PEP_ID=MMETSP1065-20121228/12219_1 /TAXON_ID=265537 /ORGANISM="Amphiprora paludosa, Strain CCMP125" /LENGTH=460 /DNA_ID=CAMNT_0013208215 /DNA_START=133 /DNA_END=1512 /DNA_ORIENTATION=+